MSGYEPGPKSARDADIRARNRRTALILASIALVFFVGAILRYALPHH